MNIRRLLLWFYHLSWKKLLGFSTLALVIAIIPLALQSANSPTRTRSEAALITKPQPVSSEFVTPKGPPEIYLVDHFFGKVDDAVLVHGANLGGLSGNTSVSLSGQMSASPGRLFLRTTWSVGRPTILSLNCRKRPSPEKSASIFWGRPPSGRERSG